MLEKIGLPAKPSLLGNSWVVDATHCQGCSSQFTFINRKHHCRRCGGIFCNSCTQQRMYLRGQGDSPVRVCDPCKKLEEAARFELRHGHRNRAGKGSSRSTAKNEDEVLAQIISSDTKGSSSSRSSLPDEAYSNLDRTESATSFSEGVSISSNPSEMGTSNPEELRQQALDEKKKYRVLKAEGKPEEALKAYKRGKELERQADALDLYLRKNRKKAALSAGNENPNPKLTDDGSTKSRSNGRPRDGGNTGKDDLLSELKELGWSETDLQSEEKKSGNMSIEGELSALLGEVSEKTDVSKGSRGIDRTEINAHKRKALMLKREGKLAEAKEELKKAKLLEKQAEEQEILGGAEGSSDDEFSDLIRTMHENKQGNTPSSRGHDQFDGIGDVMDIDNIGADLNFEVTEDDMEDPELTTALQSLGWVEEPTQVEDFSSIMGTSQEKQAGRITNESSSYVLQSNASVVKKPRRSKAVIQRELLGLKRKALSLRREGKAEEAEEVLKAAKELEDEIAEIDAPKTTHARVEPPANSSVEEDQEEEVTENDLQDPSLLGMLKDLGWQDEERQEAIKRQNQSSQGSPEIIVQSNKVTRAPRSKAKIQRELLGLKRKALELRRRGDLEEAEEVLRNAKVLEEEMEELEAVSKERMPDFTGETKAEVSKLAGPSNIAEDALKVTEKPGTSVSSIGTTQTIVEELKEPSIITHGSESVRRPDLLTGENNWRIPLAHDQNLPDAISSSAQPHAHTPNQISPGKISPEKDIITEKESGFVDAHQKTRSPIKQVILEHKKKAVALKREGRLAEAMEELKRAKLLEKSLSEEESQSQHSLTGSSSPAVPSPSIVPPVQEEQRPCASAPKPLTGRERFKIQQESLGHKRQALKLRKEGRIQEADAEFELAKALEAKLEESGPNDLGKSSLGGTEDVAVEDLLDPELLSALRAIGIEDTGTASLIPQKPKSEPAKVNAGRINVSSSSSRERSQLEEEIRAEKVKALNLKRAGKQTEALDALRRAKLLEKKLNA